MTTPRYKLGHAFSARRLILLATAGNLAIAALLVGPDFSATRYFQHSRRHMRQRALQIAAAGLASRFSRSPPPLPKASA